MIDFYELSDAWPFILVARSKIGNFTRGLYESSTFNTYDGAKMGIRRKISNKHKNYLFKNRCN